MTFDWTVYLLNHVCSRQPHLHTQVSTLFQTEYTPPPSRVKVGQVGSMPSQDQPRSHVSHGLSARDDNIDLEFSYLVNKSCDPA